MKSDAVSKTSGKEKVRRKAPIKAIVSTNDILQIVLRRLPGGFTWEQLETQLKPLPETEFIQFVPANSEEEEYKFARVYFVFKNDEDIVVFRDRFNGYVFVDSQGVESVGLVELAPNPKVARHKYSESKKRDRRCGTIESDCEFKQFLDVRENPIKLEVPSMEARLKEIEEKEKMMQESAVQETPLTQFMIKRNDDRYRRMQDKRRTKDEEKRARLQHLFEKYQRERIERKEKKITEFRNSKTYSNSFRDGSRKDSEKEKDEGENENSKQQRSNGQDRGTKNAEKRYRSESSLEKERETLQRVQGMKERSGGERINNIEKCKAKAVVSEATIKSNKDELLTKETSGNSERPVQRKTVNMRANREVAENNAENDISKKPRRNKDRPERAIYQPSAARRRMAALAKSSDSEKKIVEEH
uniref:Smg4_UPF3 domain-containing protein n=1 Tax=Syphacia muris TaxID=451379 RepID=A0A0N5AN36_9BILA